MNKQKETIEQILELPPMPKPLIGRAGGEPHWNNFVGIEVEVENFRADRRAWRHWDTVAEGSLRNGIEMVSKPIKRSAIQNALTELKDGFKKHKPLITFRTSVHAHVDVRTLTPEELIHQICISIFYEPALFRLHADWNRYENIFCVPAQKSFTLQKGYRLLIKSLKKHRAFGRVLPSKYAALNVNPVCTFGTLEYRHMGGTDNVDAIFSWIELLLLMKEAAKKQTPIQSLDRIFQHRARDLKFTDKDRVEGLEMVNYILSKEV